MPVFWGAAGRGKGGWGAEEEVGDLGVGKEIDDYGVVGGDCGVEG